MKKILTIIILSILFLPNVTKAALPCCPAGASGTNCVECVEIKNPINAGSPEVLIGNVINAVMGVVGSLALAMFIYGGFTWMLAAGNDQRVQKGKDILLWATIGLIVIFSSYALVRLVFTGIGLT